MKKIVLLAMLGLGACGWPEEQKSAFRSRAGWCQPPPPRVASRSVVLGAKDRYVAKTAGGEIVEVDKKDVEVARQNWGYTAPTDEEWQEYASRMTAQFDEEDMRRPYVGDICQCMLDAAQKQFKSFGDFAHAPMNDPKMTNYDAAETACVCDRVPMMRMCRGRR